MSAGRPFPNICKISLFKSIHTFNLGSPNEYLQRSKDKLRFSIQKAFLPPPLRGHNKLISFVHLQHSLFLPVLVTESVNSYLTLNFFFLHQELHTRVTSGGSKLPSLRQYLTDTLVQSWSSSSCQSIYKAHSLWKTCCKSFTGGVWISDNCLTYHDCGIKHGRCIQLQRKHTHPIPIQPHVFFAN